MARLTWFIIPITLLCWYKGYLLFLESSQTLYPERHRAADHKTPQDVLQQNLKEPFGFKKQSTARSNLKDSVVIGESTDQLFHFMHVSDLHMSIYKNQSWRLLDRLVSSTVQQLITPEFVLVTGDLTDAKDHNKISSMQYAREWLMYQSVLAKHGIQKDFWWDQRGNHDVFNVGGWQSRENFYTQYSMTKSEGYKFEHTLPDGTKYLFLGVDSCPVHGSGRPFNFFGYMDTADMDFVASAIKGNGDEQYNHTFIMNHYPLSTTLTGKTSQGLSFAQLQAQYGGISVVLSGHLHRLVAGLGNIMHARYDYQSELQSAPSQVLELEVGDLKMHGVYRVMAVDNDLISFVDRSIEPQVDAQITGLSQDLLGNYNDQVVVLITNPKDVRYIIAGKEPGQRMVQSSHIRFMVFSRHALVDLKVSIDGQLISEHWKLVGTKNQPMYATPWDAANYNDGRKHILRITAINENKVHGVHQVEFRLDGVSEQLDVGVGGLILQMNIGERSRLLFVFIYLVTTILLLLLPKAYSFYLHKNMKYHRWRVAYSAYLIEMDRSVPVALPSSFIPRCKQQMYCTLRTSWTDFTYFVNASVFRLVTLASLPTTFYPLLIYALYIVIGPSFIGELVPSSLSAHDSLWHRLTQKWGWFYTYGIWIEQKWVPVTDTYIYAIFEWMYIFSPLIVYLSFCITPPEQLYAPPPTSKQIEAAGRDVYWQPPIHNRRKYPLHRRFHVRMLMWLFVFYQWNNVFFVWLWYGPFAMLLSPGKTWFLVWTCTALWRHRWSSQGSEVDLEGKDFDVTLVDTLTSFYQKFAIAAKTDSPKIQSPSQRTHIGEDRKSSRLRQ